MGVAKSSVFANAYAGKRVLVLGHTGFKGTWLTQWLRRLGAEVTGLSLYIPSEPSAFEATKCDDGKNWKGDIRTYTDITRAIETARPEIIFHLAALPLVRDCYEDPKTAFETNCGGTINVLEAVRHSSSVRALVVITSDKCYENVEWIYGYREIDTLGGKDPYSASKAAAEIAFSTYFRSYFSSRSDIGVCTVRAGNVVGGGDWARDRIVPDCVRSWATGSEVVIRSPEATRPWQHVLEPLSGYLWLGAQLLTEDGRRRLSGESFNFGPRSDVEAPVIGLVEMFKRFWPSARWNVDRTGMGSKKEAGLLRLCCDKALSFLNWRAILSFSETIEFTANWYRTFYDGKSDLAAFTHQQIEEYEAKARKLGLKWAQAGE